VEEAWELAALVMSTTLKKRDYKSFGPVAKVRFRPMCEALGFEQTKPTYYTRERSGWYDCIMLSTSQWGGNSFNIFWGIKLDKDDLGTDPVLHNELHRETGKPSFWNRYTKYDIEKNAEEAHSVFEEKVEPLLQSFSTASDVGKYYLKQYESFIRENLGTEFDSLSEFDKNTFKRIYNFLEQTGLDDEVEKLKLGILPVQFTQFEENKNYPEESTSLLTKVLRFLKF